MPWGILLGDGNTGNPETNGYQSAFENQVVSTTNYGAAIIGGYGNRMENNRVISSGRTPDGTRTLFRPAASLIAGLVRPRAFGFLLVFWFPYLTVCCI